MLLDTEINQKYLALAYALQNNESQAVITPKYYLSLIQDKKVYRNYDYKINKWIYSLKPFEGQQERQPKGKGGRPEIYLDAKKIKHLKEDCNKSNREIARVLKVSEGTIRNILKKIK